MFESGHQYSTCKIIDNMTLLCHPDCCLFVLAEYVGYLVPCLVILYSSAFYSCMCSFFIWNTKCWKCSISVYYLLKIILSVNFYGMFEEFCKGITSEMKSIRLLFYLPLTKSYIDNTFKWVLPSDVVKNPLRLCRL